MSTFGFLRLIAFALLPACAAPDPAAAQTQTGEIEYEATSKYSRIRLRKSGDVRTLHFVHDNGVEMIETQMDLKQPHKLLVPYTRTMFCSYLFQPRQKRVLIIGLGGGAMVRFLQKYDPDLQVDVVEIDAEIIKIADKYFDVRSTRNVNIVTQDGFQFLQKTKRRYDAIYMDAFLNPTKQTDAVGAPLNLKTQKFLKGLHDRLTPGGVVVFNLNKHPAVNRDVANIRRSFPQTALFRVPNGVGVVAVCSIDKKKRPAGKLRKAAREIDERFRADFSFADLLKSRFR